MKELVRTSWSAASCDLCGAEAAAQKLLGTRVFRVKQKLHNYLWQHEDAQCVRCGFIFNRLRPEAEFLREYYTDCWPIASKSIVIAPDFDVGTRLELLERWLKPNAKIYEIGDKLGEFHAALVQAGYEVAGDDVMAESSERSDWLDGLFRRGVVVTPPAAMRATFDAVLAYFVIEHLANPRDWLRSIRGLLVADGRIVIEVPHFALHPKEALMHEHFLYLTPESLKALVQDAGYEVMESLDTGASRPFGFAMVARRTEARQVPSLSPLRARAVDLEAAYRRGRELLASATDNLAVSARIVAQAVTGATTATRVCFFGANQTASEIAAHLRVLPAGISIELLLFDNSDAKTGIAIEGFAAPVAKPHADLFEPSVLHVCVICSRGWTQKLAEQIRSFRLPCLVLVDGAAGCLLPAD